MSETTTATPTPAEVADLRDRLAAAEERAARLAAERRDAHERESFLAEQLHQAQQDHAATLAALAAHAADVAAARSIGDRYTAALNICRQAWELADGINELGEPVPEHLDALVSALIARFAPNDRPGVAWLWVKDGIAAALDAAAPMPAEALIKHWTRAIGELRDQAHRAEVRAAERVRQAEERERLAWRAVNRASEHAERCERKAANLAALVADALPELADAAELGPPRTPPYVSPGEIKGRLSRWADVALELRAGLDGSLFHWRAVDAQHKLPIVAAMGLTLATRSHLERLGLRLKKGASPVGVRYYHAPISREAAVFILECQATKAEREEEL